MPPSRRTQTRRNEARREQRAEAKAEHEAADDATAEREQREAEWLRIDAQTKAAEEARLQRPPEEDADESEDE